MKIVDLAGAGETVHEQAAGLLHDGFVDGLWGGWPDLDSARGEVREFLESPGWISRAALDAGDRLEGWIGAVPHYDGHAWELHPLVVRADRRRCGLGTALVADLEERVRRRGANTLWLGCDDETGRTSLHGEDLYPDPLDHLSRIRNLREHPFEFYQRMGFVLVGVIPDANGPGKPDLLMAKRLGGAPA